MVSGPLSHDEIRAWCVALGLDGAEKFDRQVFHAWARQVWWEPLDRSFTDRVARQALAGSPAGSVGARKWKRSAPFSIAARDLRFTRHVVLDVDVHRVENAWPKHRRGMIAGTLRRVVTELRRKFPTLPFAAFATPRGAHVVILLDRLTRVRRAHALGMRLLAEIDLELPEGDAIEVFPAQTGSTCRLPCTGQSRLLGEDLEQVAHAGPGGRARDVRALLALRRATAADFGVDSLEGEEEIEAVQLELKKHRTAELEREQSRDAAGKLRGADFVAEVVSMHRDGVKLGRSWDAARRLSWLLVVAAGLTEGQALAGLQRFAELGHHEARHFSSENGQRAWMRSARACVRRCRGLIESGEQRPGKLRSGDLWSVVTELTGEQAPPVSRSVRRTPGARDAMLREYGLLAA
jgi:hypothetical protein